jgi:hypothetical protein
MAAAHANVILQKQLSIKNDTIIKYPCILLIKNISCVAFDRVVHEEKVHARRLSPQVIWD